MKCSEMKMESELWKSCLCFSRNWTCADFQRQNYRARDEYFGKIHVPGREDMRQKAEKYADVHRAVSCADKPWSERKQSTPGYMTAAILQFGYGLCFR